MVSTVTSHRNRSAARDYGGLFPFDLPFLDDCDEGKKNKAAI